MTEAMKHDAPKRPGSQDLRRSGGRRRPPDPGRSGVAAGLRKEEAAIDEWAKDVAPSTELRKWYGHVPDRFQQFEARYREELATSTARTALDQLRGLAKDNTLTLLTATKDVEHSQAAVLARALLERR